MRRIGELHLALIVLLTSSYNSVNNINGKIGFLGVCGQAIDGSSQNPTISVLKTNPGDIRFDAMGGASNNSEVVARSVEGTDTVFVVPSSLYVLNVFCYAPYPVAWFLQDDFPYNTMVSWHARIDTRRTALDVFDHTTFNYSSVLSLSGDTSNKLTGRYICRSTRQTSLSTNAYLYWQGSTEQYLVRTQENITISLDEVTSGRIILPCFVSSPKYPAILFKFDDSDSSSVELRLNDSISYDPKIGFTLTKLATPGGTYKCVTNTRRKDFDYVLFQVPDIPKPEVKKIITPKPTTKPPPPPPVTGNSTNSTITTTTTTTTTPRPVTTPPPTPPPPKLKSNPTLKYNPDRQEMVCCTGGGIKKAPTIYHYFCDQPQTCNYRSRALTSRLFHEWAGGKTRKNGCATYKLQPHNNGIIRCVGDDFERQIEYIFPLRNTFGLGFRFGLLHPPDLTNQTRIKPWLSWNEISPEDMMIVQRQPPPRQYRYKMSHAADFNDEQNDVEKPIFDGQQVTIECQISNYYFASGIKWAIKFKNDTVQILDSSLSKDVNTNPDLVMNHDGHYDALTLIADEMMDYVTCIAPVWNSSVWVNKAFHLSVHESKVPVMSNVTTDFSPTWFLNDTLKKISCMATASPLPTFTWMKDNQTIQNGTNIEIISDPQYQNSTSQAGSTLIVRRVSHSNPGVYTCQASNLAGDASMSFTVTVSESSTWKKTLTIFLGIFIGLALVALIAFLGWKIKGGRLTIGQLSAAGLGGGPNMSGGLNSNDIHNRSFDASATNMNRELLD